MLKRFALRHLLIALLASALLACGSTPPAPISSPAPSGFYRVKQGDTLYRIAKNHGQSVSDLARWNKLSSASAIEVGQLLQIRPPSGSATPTPRPSTPSPTSSPTPRPSNAQAILQWPGDGEVIYRFDGQRNKGIGIAASAGSPVKAAAAGKVVYAGDGIRSYGLLVIIKHDNGLLTTYAHNQKLLIKEGQTVAAGQVIANAGSTGTDRVKIHFEVRQNGNAVDPLLWLVAR